MRPPLSEFILRVNVISTDFLPGTTAEIGVTTLSNPRTEVLANWKLVEYTLGLCKRKEKDKVSFCSVSKFSVSSPTDVSS